MTETVKLGLSEAIELAWMAVSEKPPNYKYTDSDWYTNNEYCVNAVEVDGVWEPSCLVGTILWNWDGIPKEQLTSPSGPARFYQGYLDKDTLIFLETIQNLQDHGTSWKLAVTVVSVLIANMTFLLTGEPCDPDSV